MIVDAKKLLLESLVDDSIWNHGSFKEENSELFIALVNKYGPGLITNFLLTVKFKEAARRKNSGCGYWMFDGDSIDVEGKWVSCDDDVEYRNSLSAIVDQEITKAEEKYRELKLLMNELFTSSENDEKRVSENTFGGGSVPQHAMVLLGGRKFSEGKKTKIYFICQNTWPNMELVVCSRKYLEACQAKVLFRVADIGLELRNDLATSPNFIVDYASPYSSSREDVNDNTNLALLFANDTPSPERPCIGNPFNDSFDFDDNDY